MKPEQIQEAVENYPMILEKKDQLQKRIIKLAGGRNPEKEALLFYRLKTVEMQIELIDYAIDSDDILTLRENFAVYARTEGLTCDKIAKVLNLSKTSASRLLLGAYKKMAESADIYIA